MKRNGSASILLVALLALGALGLSLWPRERPQVPSRYRNVVESTMKDVGRATGLSWRTEKVSVSVIAGTRFVNGYWCRYIESEGRWLAGFAYGGRRLNVYADPSTMNINGGVGSVLGHELAHVLFNQHHIPSASHHKRMRQCGILTGR